MNELETKQIEKEINNQEGETEMTEEEMLQRIAEEMKDNTASPDDKKSFYSFLYDVAQAEDTKKLGNLRDDKELNELGLPESSVRNSLDMALVSDMIMENDYFKEFFEKQAENTLATSLSRQGFLVRQGTTQTKQVADITKKRTINKGWFGKEKINESGGDTTGAGS